jgi:hypothetical protein
VDRYIALGDSARDAWSLRASGGVENIPVTAWISASTYAQTGVIGVHSRDAYVDGWARLHAPITDSGGDIRLSAGATVWAAAQPGASRIDIGPSIDVGGNIGRAGLRGSLDYRIRVSGNAAPGNGPAFTLQAGF